MVNVAEVVAVFPQASEAVNITVTAPVAPHKSDKAAALKLLLQVTLLYGDVDSAPPLLFNHAVRAVEWFVTSQATDASDASGAIVSWPPPVHKYLSVPDHV